MMNRIGKKPLVTVATSFAAAVGLAIVFSAGTSVANAGEHSAHNHTNDVVAAAINVEGLSVGEKLRNKFAPPSRNENGLKTLGDRCQGVSELPRHTGFQSATPVCVDTEFGEQSSQQNNPTLLIVSAPATVGVGQNIVLKVSTQNLIRDRFLAAGQGGYYLEMARLKNGFTRGHFHTACQQLGNTNAAPEPLRNANFVATEDGKGGGTPDTVTVTVPGFAQAGLVRCAAWAGDGSHRIPMMSFANEIPAFDTVRLTVQ